MTSKDILSHFRFEDVGSRIEELETPVPVIDIGIVARNLTRWQARCDAAGIANRPHIKTHKLVALAKRSWRWVRPASPFRNSVRPRRWPRPASTTCCSPSTWLAPTSSGGLPQLARRTSISVVADSAAVVEGLGRAGENAGRRIGVLVECDTGASRNGVQTPQAAAELARLLDATPGLAYGGLMTYPKAGMRNESSAFLAEARDLAASAGLETRTISIGGSPDMWKDDGLTAGMEYRAGTYIYFDRSLAERGTCSFDDCALSVLATVVSRPTAAARHDRRRLQGADQRPARPQRLRHRPLAR